MIGESATSTQKQRKTLHFLCSILCGKIQNEEYLCFALAHSKTVDWFTKQLMDHDQKSYGKWKITREKNGIPGSAWNGLLRK
jgi:hypothetical protein